MASITSTHAMPVAVALLFALATSNLAAQEPLPSPARAAEAKRSFVCRGCVSVPDQDGDGRPDLLVGDMFWPSIEKGRGAVFLARSKEQLQLSQQPVCSGEPGEHLGSLICDAGDVDGDGVQDVAIASTQTTRETQGRILLLSGKGLGLLRQLEIPREASTKLDAGMLSLCALPACERHAAPELVCAFAGTPECIDGIVLHLATDQPRVLRADACVQQPESQAKGVSWGARWGCSLLGIGDLDGDGCAELCVGAPGLRLDGSTGVLTCLSGKDGQVLWRRSSSTDGAPFACSLALLVPSGSTGGPLLAAGCGSRTVTLLDGRSGEPRASLRDPTPYVGEEGAFGTSVAACRNVKHPEQAWLAVGSEDPLQLDHSQACVFDRNGSLLYRLDTGLEQTVVFAIADLDGDDVEELAISILGRSVRIVSSRTWTGPRASSASKPADALFEILPR